MVLQYIKTTDPKALGAPTRVAAIPEDTDIAYNTIAGHHHDGVDSRLILAGGVAPADASYITTAAEAGLSNEKVLGSEIIMTGAAAGKPAFGVAGRIYVETDGSFIVWRDTGAAWVEIARGEAGLRLAQLAEKAHGSLTGVTSDQHHAQAHTLASHSTKAHAELTGVGANDHHAQLHQAQHQVGGGDSLVGLLSITMQLTEALAVDLTAQGIVTTLTAGENLVFGNVAYLKAADSRMWKAKADAEATSKPLLALAIATINAGNAGLFLLVGFARNDAWGWTIGAPLFLSAATGGAMTNTAPAAATNQIRVLGQCSVAATRIWFCPSGDWFEHA